MPKTYEKIDVNPVIKKRWSPRAFSQAALSEEQVTSLFEAARLAPSNYNLQPWRFIYAHKDETENYGKILDTLWELNQMWAKNAPLLVVAVAEMINPVTGELNNHAWHDVGLAMENMVLQAETLDIKAHQMGGFDDQKAKEALQIPDHFEPVSVTAFGYAGDPDQLPEQFRENERKPSERKPQKTLFFRGIWKHN